MPQRAVRVLQDAASPALERHSVKAVLQAAQSRVQALLRAPFADLAASAMAPVTLSAPRAHLEEPTQGPIARPALCALGFDSQTQLENKSANAAARTNIRCLSLEQQMPSLPALCVLLVPIAGEFTLQPLLFTSLWLQRVSCPCQPRLVSSRAVRRLHYLVSVSRASLHRLLWNWKLHRHRGELLLSQSRANIGNVWCLRAWD